MDYDKEIENLVRQMNEDQRKIFIELLKQYLQAGEFPVFSQD